MSDFSIYQMVLEMLEPVTEVSKKKMIMDSDEFKNEYRKATEKLSDFALTSSSTLFGNDKYGIRIEDAIEILESLGYKADYKRATMSGVSQDYTLGYGSNASNNTEPGFYSSSGVKMSTSYGTQITSIQCRKKLKQSKGYIVAVLTDTSFVSTTTTISFTHSM